MSSRLELHPVYGAIPRDGDLVSEGDVLGLSADGSATISAPFDGLIRLFRSCEGEASRLYAEILPSGAAEKEAGMEPTSSLAC